ncbi:MAG: deoxyhypusine synthase family protein [Lacunisphaera sp.]
MLHQDLGRTSVPLWGYFCQISDSTTSYGSYSGAVPNEKITWGKLGEKTPKYIIESDATIVAPLIFAWGLGSVAVEGSSVESRRARIQSNPQIFGP